MSKENLQFVDEKGKETNIPNQFAVLEPNTHLLHLAFLRQLGNARAGTASTKTKSEVRGGGKKPWKQKGTGRARAGSSRSPLWVGGGIIFGPKPRSFKTDLTQKSRSLAIAQAFAAKSNETIILNKLPKIENAKTKNLVSTIKTWSSVKLPALVVLDKDESGYEDFKRASGNIPGISIADHAFVGVYEILKATTLVITKAALSKLEKRFELIFEKKKAKKEKKKDKKAK